MAFHVLGFAFDGGKNNRQTMLITIGRIVFIAVDYIAIGDFFGGGFQHIHMLATSLAADKRA